nr:MAG TPA: hypothetical protein [Caudoviricetes sp.]
MFFYIKKPRILQVSSLSRHPRKCGENPCRTSGFCILTIPCFYCLVNIF